MPLSAMAAILAVLAGPARAAETSSYVLDPAAITPRETFLAAGIGAMIACAVTSFFLAERVTERTHAALAALVVLIGGFCLFTLFGLVGREIPVAGSLVLLGLIGLFKLMNQFEIRRKRDLSDK
jgi:formate-dependent nitrite reductase membrane component NrfD